MVKRTFEELRKEILLSLSKGQKTINQISSDTSINWKTVELQLTYLMGRRLVDEIFSSSFARIFEITEEGMGNLKKQMPKKNIHRKEKELFIVRKGVDKS